MQGVGGSSPLVLTRENASSMMDGAFLFYIKISAGMQFIPADTSRNISRRTRAGRLYECPRVASGSCQNRTLEARPFLEVSFDDGA